LTVKYHDAVQAAKFRDNFGAAPAAATREEIAREFGAALDQYVADRS